MMTDDELFQRLENSTKNAVLHQLETLNSILDHQRGVRYLQPYLGGNNLPIDAATFRRLVPLSSYDDFADHINHMANGAIDRDRDHDQPLLSVDPLVCFFYSSGTSSMKPKLIPFFDSTLSKAAAFIAPQGSAAVLRKLFPPRPEVSKSLWFIYADDATTTKGGYRVMAASTFPLQIKSNGNSSWSQMLSCVSPREVIMGTNIEHQMYCHLLCGLGNFHLIDAIRAVYAIGLVRAFGMLESKWGQLCVDIENGIPSSEINDLAMRNSVVEVLGGPQPDLSNRIRLIFEAKNWGGILSKLWPNLRYIRCVTTGSMRQYYSKLKYYAGEVPILGGDYFASECCVGINLDVKQPPEMTKYVMLPTAAYFEFLAFDMNESRVVGEETVDLSCVEVGKLYEVVVTTYRGLYRYRLGDIVRVVGFHNSSPLVEFVMRAPKSSDEIITERYLSSAMESFQLELRNVMGIEIVEFASFLDLELRPKGLKVFVEVREEGCVNQQKKVQLSDVALKQCCYSIEDGLGGLYKVQRDRGEIGPLVVIIVQPGSFDRLLQMAVENGAPASQYKPPKIIRNHQIVNFMERSALMTLYLESSTR